MADNRPTKQLKYCDSGERGAASKRSRAENEEEEEADLQFPATKLQRQLQQEAPFSEPDSGVGSSSNCERSSSSKRKFEVFISHRGPDTKRTLAYHMYDLLCDRGVEVFFDKEELQSGERVPLAIEEAIKCSKVDVCILSSGFAESAWCLKELEIMVNKYEMGRSKLIPIFYDVKPSDVRHLQGAFGQSFQTKIIDKNKYPTQLIDKWRRSLRKISDITGEEGKGECCKAIVNKILQKLDVGLLDVSSSNIVGRQKELLSLKHDIMKCCHNGCGVTSVEISGMGGIGKTTFAKQLYNQICPQYERCCFIEDVGGLVEKSGVNEVYKQLISNLLRYDPNNSKIEGKKLLKIRLKDTKILVVFDNIQSKIPLSTVFIEDDVSLDPSSIIIVTTREKDVLKHDPRVALYCKNLIPLELSNLDFHNSNKLFCQYAFRGTSNVMNEFDEPRKSIIEKCHGIPLALILLGSQLYKREIKFWKYLQNSLKDSLHPHLKKILKISYDNLDRELEKCLFLDVATFFLLEKEDLLVQLRRQRDDEESESEILLALETLKTKNLIKVKYGFLKMHDLLVDLGRSIVQDEDSCPAGRSRVWHPSDVRIILCDEEMGTNKLKALSLVFRGSAVLNDGCPWPADAFRKLSSLEFLILQGPCMEGDLSKLSKKLSWLKWIDFPYKYMPERLCLKHMKVLQLSSQWLTLLWKHHEDAPINLRQLSLSNCKNLKRLPKFTAKFKHLTCIELKRCTSFETIPDSFGQLQALQHLQLMGCFKIKSLPESFGKLLQLRKLKIHGCIALKCLPESFGMLSRLETLEMPSCKALQCLPKSFGTLSRLETLNMWSCQALQCLPESFGTLSQLKTLEMGCCQALQCLPESFGTLSRLETLEMQNCQALQCLPESFGILSRLETLEMQNCQALQCLPNSFGKLLQLRKLDIHSGALKCLLESFGHLRHLEKVQITSCNDLEKLLESTGDLLNLLKLQMFAGSKIRFSAMQFHRLPRSHNLYISRSKDSMNIEYSSCGKAGGREQQNIGYWKNSNCYGQATQQHLTWLVRSQCPGVKSQNRAAADLVSDNNEHAPPQLSDVELMANHFLAWFESTSHILQQVHVLFLNGLWNLQELPQCVGNLRHLTILQLCGCASLEWLPDTIGNLQDLTELVIEDCIVLKGLPSWLGNISSLETLQVSHCWMVEVIHMQGLVNLNTLKVIGCINLRSIIGLSVLPKLLNLIIKGCLNLRDLAITGGCATFNSLKSLIICGCYQLCLPNKSLVQHVPNQLYCLKLSLNHDSLEASLDEENQTLPNILQWSSNLRRSDRVLNAKTSPLLFSAVTERVRELLSTKDDSSHCFHKLSHDARLPSEDDNFDSSYSFFNKLSHDAHVPRKDKDVAAVLCFVSAAYAVDFPMHIPPPHTTFSCQRFVPCQRFDLGEEIHIATGCIELSPSCELRIQKARDCGQSYEAVVKEGWLILLDDDHDRGLSTEIYDIFCSEVMKQRWLSRAWTELPSQLCISEFSALDIANCQITKTSRHFNTYIMEEESDLTWKRRRCLFMDDHALLLENPRKNGSKHGFLAYTRLRKNSNHGILADLPYTGLHLDLEAVVANMYQMSISVSGKGKLNSRKLQEIVSLNEPEIPVALNTLLQTNASDSTLAALHKKKMQNMHNQRTFSHFFSV